MNTPHKFLWSCALAAAATILALSGTADAQVVPGDSPNMGVGNAVANSPRIFRRSYSPDNGWQEEQAERQHRETLRRIPDKKQSNDPWRTIRPAATAQDRHRPE